MNKAYVFQHNTTGVQIFVYHAINNSDALRKFYNLVIDPSMWTSLGMKSAI